jgi:two-component system sensor histidine kinase QseC
MGSLRARLLVGTLGASALLLAGSGTLVYLLVRAALYAEFDAALGTQARALTTLVEIEGSRLRLEYDAEQLPEYARRERPDYFCFWTADGALLYRSPSLTGELPRLRGTAAEPGIRSALLPDGRPGRLAGLAFAPRREGDHDQPAPARRLVDVTIARDTLAIDRELGRLAALLIAVGALAMAVAAAGMAWLVGGLLRPVRQLAGRIAGMDAEHLHTRIGGDGVPAELRPVAARLDELLTRLEAAFVREKSFTADAAHELRTPLAGLRTTMEVALSRERDGAAYREALGDCLAIGTQMQALVDNLLSLARLEAGRTAITRQPLELGPFVAECWKPFAAGASARRLRVGWTLAERAVALADREKLRLVLTNLFDNAVAYADQGGEVGISGALADGQLAIAVTNTGCTLTRDQAVRVFDRFWRGDAARSAVGVHCGLGLALCRKLVELLGGRISASVGDGRFTVELAIPVGR